MLRIQITAHKNLPTPDRMVAEFGEQGGNIGRAVGNALVLPDPARHISRTHASVAYRNGKYVIRDLGTVLPVVVNGRTLGNGNEATLELGDEIAIGGYTLRVDATDAPPMATRKTPDAVPPPPVDVATSDDPLATLGKGGATDPFGDLLGPLTTPAPPANPVAPTPRPAQAASAASNTPLQLIPEDFDPFADPKPPTDKIDALPDDLNSALGPATTESSNIDQLFGLDSGGGSALQDSLGMAHESVEHPVDVEATSSLDPMVLLGLTSSEKSSPVPQRDDMSEIQRAYRPPQARPEKSKPASSAPPQPRRTTRESAASNEFDMVLSWENEHADGGEAVSTRVVPSPKTERPRGVASRAEVNLASNPEKLASDQRRPTPTRAPSEQPQPVSFDGGSDELLRALLAGAGVADLKVPGGLTPEMMTRLGQLLREATQGTLDLLLARALTKREVRLDMTMISSRDNNPLKFSPSVEVALAQMLTPPKRGFMTPTAAMKDAYDDLRSHQFGFMAGMRAALAGVLERLNPVQLEPRLKQKSMLDSLVPMNRKAKLWDLFVEYYQDIAKDVEDDFHTLFGKEFLRAYEAQIAKLEQEDEEKR